MTEGEHGWWETSADVPAHGTRYMFRVDGEGPFPDPRSPFQPDGVHGASQTVDHAAFAWNDHAFVPTPMTEAILYELHVGTFSPEGTYEGAARRLPHLADLGITHVEIMPIGAFPGDHGWGYDGTALFAPHAPYGTPDQLKTFVQEAHRLGLAVLLDVVYNHFGPAGNYVERYGSYLTDHYKTPWGDAVNFDDRDCGGVREFVCDNALMWLRDYHFDGLRLDAVHAIHDESALHILEELVARVRQFSEQQGRNYVLIAESDLNAPRLVQPRAFGGYGLDAHWADDFHHALHAYFTGEQDGIHRDFGTLQDVAKALRQAYVYDGQYSEYRGRPFGRTPKNVAPSQLVVFSQNHDQTGNRAHGDRLVHILDEPRSKAIAALVLLSPFVPLLFQGEEWGASSPFLYFSDHESKLGKQIAEGRRRDFEKFGWAGSDIPDPQARDTFEKSQLHWSELEEPRHGDILTWYRALIALRPCFQKAAPEVHFDEIRRWLTMRRGDWLVALNLADQTQRVPLPEAEWQLRLASAEASHRDRVAAWGVVVMERLKGVGLAPCEAGQEHDPEQARSDQHGHR